MRAARYWKTTKNAEEYVGWLERVMMMDNKTRNELVEQHLHVVIWIIRKDIRINENIQGLGFDDLYQVGCLALCHAAERYDGRVLFETFAKTVVRNRLYDHCSAAAKRRIWQSCDGENCAYVLNLSYKDTDSLSEQAAIDALLQAKSHFTGSARKGIEALELKIKGYSGKEIAEMYGVKPNLVGAWISKAAKKLREDRTFLDAIR